MMEKNIKKQMLLFFGIGLFLGIIVAVIGKECYLEEYKQFFRVASLRLNQGKLSYGLLFWERLKTIVFLCFCVLAFSSSVLWPVYYAGYIISKGAAVGFLMTSLGITFALRGILYCILYSVPQIFFYVPGVIIMLYEGIRLYQETNKRKGLKKQLLPIGVSLALLITGGIFETFANPFIIKQLIFLVAER